MVIAHADGVRGATPCSGRGPVPVAADHAWTLRAASASVMVANVMSDPRLRLRRWCKCPRARGCLRGKSLSALVAALRFWVAGTRRREAECRIILERIVELELRSQKVTDPAEIAKRRNESSRRLGRRRALRSARRVHWAAHHRSRAGLRAKRRDGSARSPKTVCNEGRGARVWPVAGRCSLLADRRSLHARATRRPPNVRALLDRYVELLVREQDPKAPDSRDRTSEGRSRERKPKKDTAFASCPKEVSAEARAAP